MQIKKNVAFKYIESSYSTASPQIIRRIKKITVKYTCKRSIFAAEEAE